MSIAPSTLIMRLATLLIVVHLSLLLHGCAAFEPDDSASMGQTLMSAGFEAVPAQTPEQIEALEKLEQHVLQPRDKDGKPMFVYADAEDCVCAYWGDKAAFERYQTLSEQSAKEAENKNPYSRIEPWSQGPWWVY